MTRGRPARPNAFDAPVRPESLSGTAPNGARAFPVKGTWIPAARRLAFVHGAYFVLTGVWPLLHIPSFVAVTGPKTDLWLVRTVGLLVCVPGALLLHAAYTARIRGEAVFAGTAAGAALMLVDIFYTANGTIGPIYMADAAVEAVLLVLWAVVLIARHRAA